MKIQFARIWVILIILACIYLCTYPFLIIGNDAAPEFLINAFWKVLLFVFISSGILGLAQDMSGGLIPETIGSIGQGLFVITILIGLVIFIKNKISPKPETPVQAIPTIQIMQTPQPFQQLTTEQAQTMDERPLYFIPTNRYQVLVWNQNRSDPTPYLHALIIDNPVLDFSTSGITGLLIIIIPPNFTCNGTYSQPSLFDSKLYCTEINRPDTLIFDIGLLVQQSTATRDENGSYIPSIVPCTNGYRFQIDNTIATCNSAPFMLIQ